MNEFLTSSNIVGIDIGNLTTVAYSNLGEFIVESRVGEASKMDEFVNEGDIFGFNNQILVTNSGTFENDTIKFKKSNFLTLLNLAIAKTTDRDNVSIVIGIPAGQYSSLRDEMKQFILENNKNQIRLGNSYDNLNRARDITIENVFVVPEGYGLKTEAKIVEQCKENVNTYVVDVGGGTTDIAVFGPKFKFLDGDSIRFGLLDLYSETRKKINSTFNVSVSLEDSKKYMDGELELLDENFEKQYRSPLIQKAASRIISDFNLSYPDARTSNIVLDGGGAKKMEYFFKQKYPQVIVAGDVIGQARSLYKIGVKKWIK